MSFLGVPTVRLFLDLAKKRRPKTQHTNGLGFLAAVWEGGGIVLAIELSLYQGVAKIIIHSARLSTLALL